MKLEFRNKVIKPRALLGASTFWYLGSPYSKYPGGLAEAFEVICTIAGRLTEDGVVLFCPIAHSHPIAVIGEVDPTDADLWKAFDKPFVNAAHGLIVAKMPGWEDSFGLQHEIEEFKLAQKPIVWLTPGEEDHDALRDHASN